MGVIEIIIVGIGLAMDAATVAMVDGIVEKNMKFRKIIFIALVFSLLQGIMPIISFYAASLFKDLIKEISSYLAFTILFILGLGMLNESKKKELSEMVYSYPKIFIQGIATSMDAFIVGISFAFLDVDIFEASFIITIITFILCILFIYLAKRFASILKDKAIAIGGVILIVIAYKILFS